jgi:transcriptional regulator with XRE-family HTH domain
MARNSEKFNYEVADIAQKLIGRACADRRKDIGYTQAELAEKAGTHQHHIANFENGKQNVTFRIFIAILGCLDMHIDLMAKDGDKPVGFKPLNKN